MASLLWFFFFFFRLLFLSFSVGSVFDRVSVSHLIAFQVLFTLLSLVGWICWISVNISIQRFDVPFLLGFGWRPKEQFGLLMVFWSRELGLDQCYLEFRLINRKCFMLTEANLTWKMDIFVQVIRFLIHIELIKSFRSVISSDLPMNFSQCCFKVN